VTGGSLETGWELVGHPPLLLRPTGGAAPPAPAELEVERVAGARSLAAFEATLVEGYPLQELRPARPGCLYRHHALAEGRLRCLVGGVEGRPVSVAAAPAAVHALAAAAHRPGDRPGRRLTPR